MELNNKQLGALTSYGVSMAKSLLAIESKANQSKKAMLIELAGRNYDKARYTIVLDSYQANLVQMGMSEATAKVRKSEALQVIKAVELTQVTGDNLNVLASFEGEYNLFIAKARELQKVNAPAKEAKEAKAKPLSEKGAIAVSEGLEKATTPQLHSFISEAVGKIQQSQAPTMAGLSALKLINNIAVTALKNNDIEAYIIEQLKALETISNEAISKVENAQKMALETSKAISEKLQVAESL